MCVDVIHLVGVQPRLPTTEKDKECISITIITWFAFLIHTYEQEHNLNREFNLWASQINTNNKVF